MNKINIFLSYCWSDSNEADKIYNYFKNSQNIELHRDTIDIGKWESIKEYMQSISNMDYTILLISDSYLKSANCMYEVLEVIRDRDYRDKIFPAVICSGIYSPIIRAKYVKHWQDEFSELEINLKEIKVQNLGKLNEDLKRRQDISSNIAEFLYVVSDMNNPNIEDVCVRIEEKLSLRGFLGSSQKDGKGEVDSQSLVENRAEEYAGNWDKNVFLNNFDEEDEKAGVNVKLKDIFIDDCLPHYIWKTNTKPSDKLSDLLAKYVNDKNGKKMLLILGQPGIGKSTLITWIMTNLVKKKEDILVYQFATDLKSIDWQSKNVLNDICSAIGVEYNGLENKTLILDGFDEIYTGSNRERILNKLNAELQEWSTLKSFSLVITCRENYIYDLENIKCAYITLQVWEETQIDNFCRTFWGKCGNDILEDKIQKIQENKEIFGIPLILYMILALDINIENGSSVMDIYDQIFSVKKGGIYDRCYDTEHRINTPKIKKNIHQISQRIAFWIFENNDEKAFISKDKFEEICENYMSEFGDKIEEIQTDTLIGNFYKLKHCEGKGADELQFVHRSIYEYFVTVYFFESIHKLESKEEVAGKLGELLKKGHLSEQILEFIKYKFDGMKELNLPDITKDIFNIMLKHGMTYYTEVEEPYNNVIERERNILSNMLEVVGLWNSPLGKLDKRIIIYLQCNREKKLNLCGIQLGEKNAEMKIVDLSRVNLSEANLSGADLGGADLFEADLSGADLSGANLVRAYLVEVDLCGADLRKADLRGADLNEAGLIGANLVRANLSEANLIGADLRRADLRDADLILVDLSKANLSEANLSGTNLGGADLGETNLSETNIIGADLSGANLSGADLGVTDLSETIFDEWQVNILHEKYDLSKSRVLLSEEDDDEIISYQEYCIRKQKG